MQQISFNPAGIFSLKDTLKIYKGKNKFHKIRKLSGLSLNPLFKKECHLLSDKLESMDTFFYPLLHLGYSRVPSKKFSSFGPAVCPAIANIYKYI